MESALTGETGDNLMDTTDIGETAGAQGGVPAWLETFPALQAVKDPVWLEVMQRARVAELPQGYPVFRDGDPCERYILVLSGATSVFKDFESGKQMLLYRLGAGEACSLTTSVLLAGGVYSASAVTEAETRAVLIAAADFHRAFDESKGFRDYVCSTFGGRVRDLIMLIESVVTRQVDVRLAKWLLRNRHEGDTIEVSHRELAFELGTAREVVSRQLKDFANSGWVQVSRRSIAIADENALRNIAAGCGQ